MKAGFVRIPDVWRGSDYLPVTVQWMDGNGQPFFLGPYEPFMSSEAFDFDVAVIPGPYGLTQFSLTREETEQIPIGQYRWDWIWRHRPTGTIFPGIFLRGIVEVKEPLPQVS